MTVQKQKKPCVSYKHNIKLLSWNIQSSQSTLGNKFEDPQFTEIFKDTDFVCLQETRQTVKCPGYRSLCNVREGERSGGVCILYSNQLIGGIEQVKNRSGICKDIVICKLKRSFFKLDEDLFIVNAYASPANSSRQSCAVPDGTDTLHQLENTVNELQRLGKVILCGDINARIGIHPGQLQNEELDEHVPLPDNYRPDAFSFRNSQDMTTNTFGKRFLSLVMNNRLTILNGRTLGDLQGAFTSIQVGGCSVIDYFAVSSDIEKCVTSMCVGAFTLFSDHKPLSLELSCNPLSIKAHSSLDSAYEPAPTRFLTNETSRDNFTELQQSECNTVEIAALTSCIDREEPIEDINRRYVKYLQGMASECFKSTKVTKKRNTANQPWFNGKCRSARRLLNKAARTVSKFPDSDFLRQNFYKAKHSYKRIKLQRKQSYTDKLNTDIESGKVLNWQQFKKLKSRKTDKLHFDSTDMNNFETFFKELYSDNHATITKETKEKLISEADRLNNEATVNPTTLNEDITTDEVEGTIKSLKTGKASAIDKINNEMLKYLNDENKVFLTKMFNYCLETGSYPWSVSVITPLHKKGSKDDPDNYRAVAVSSVIGKLFSTVLLNRLIKYRKENCPDPPNQLGFTKGAQTYDHILTMQTIASKYRKLKSNVYAVFVDFRKAFDSVCRQALFLKLAKSGATGKFYDVLRAMYSKSKAYIKLSGRLSKQFDINKGTEQGHPLSPDLFKIFLSDLSELLELKNCPSLWNKLISHLLFADDLILLALDSKTAQDQINKLIDFCKEWGIEINELKTKAVIFGHDITKSLVPKFIINGKPLEIVDSYCYLGIILHKSGKLAEAKNSLKTKAMRAFFGMKRTLNRTKLSTRAVTTLFDSLIKPILLYGAPIWTPTSSIIKNLSAAASDPQEFRNVISKINRTVAEKVHMSFLKWALGVNRKSSNVGTWGEAGRYPLIYQSIKLTLNYYSRVKNMSKDSFAYAAFREQQNLNLPWYKNIESLLKLDPLFDMDHVTAYNSTLALKRNHFGPKGSYSPTSIHLLNNLSSLEPLKPQPSKRFRTSVILKALSNHFKECWNHEKSKSSKLAYYHSIKHRFGREPYLDVIKNSSHRYRTTKLRISAHDFEIEKGRYTNTPRDDRICKWCHLTFNSRVTEDESHVLFSCDLHAKDRNKLISDLVKARVTMSDGSNLFKNLNHSTLANHLMQLISPNTEHPTSDSNTTAGSFTQHHLTNAITSDNSPHSQQQKQLRAYIFNSVCAYINKCFENRHLLASHDDKRKRKFKSLTIILP